MASMTLMLLHILGINGWFRIYHAAGCIGIAATLQILNTFIFDLSSMENIDEDELDNSHILGQKIARLLLYTTHTNSILSSSFDTTNIASKLKDNPLLNTNWLSPEERAAFAKSIKGDTPILPLEKSTTPSLKVNRLSRHPPPRSIEWESSKEAGCLWRIPNINNMTPISIKMWQSWASLSAYDIKRCRDSALRGFSWIESSPPSSLAGL